MQNILSKQFIPAQPLKTAVLFLVFNRLDTTKQVFEAIRLAKPPRLYIAADGPRDSRPSEDEKVKAVRDYVMGHIDWDCEVKTLFREKNLGCKYAVSGGIDWFFENEEMGIILEDDCLPNPSFFRFCEVLLQKYKNDTRISMITGTSYLFNEIQSDDDYFFSKYMSIWGWASWRKSWSKYDINMPDWPKVKENNLLNSVFFWDANIKDIFSNYYELGYKQEIDTWDYQWAYRCVIESGYCITPYKNLVSNLGFEGTRYSTNSPFINMSRLEISNVQNLKLNMPVLQSYEIDKIVFYNIFYRFQKNKVLIQLLKKLRLHNFVKLIYRVCT